MIKTLLFVTNDAFYFFTHRIGLARAARAAGFEVHVATPPSDAVGLIRAEGLLVHEIRLRRGNVWPHRELRAIGDIIGLFRRLRPSMVYLLTLKPILYGAFAARIMGIKAVLAFTGLGYPFSENTQKAVVIRALTRITLGFAISRAKTRIIVQNSDDRRLLAVLSKLTEEEIFLVRGSGVDPALYAPNATSPASIVILASRMLWSKGVADFVEAARILRPRFPALRMVLAGQSDPENPLSIPETILSGWGREGLVEWWGWTSNLPEILPTAAVVCLPSAYREGVPRVLIEAAASGVAIVATDVPGCREIVRHGWNGLVVPPRSPLALAEAIEFFLSNEGERRRMGANGRELVRNEFSEKSVVKQTLDVVKGLVDPAFGPGETTIRLGRVLHAVTLSEIGGAQQVVKMLVQGTRARADVAVATAPGGPLVEQMQHMGVPVVEVGSFVRKPSLQNDFLAFLNLLKVIRTGGFSIVHAHSTKAGLLARAVCALVRGPKVVFTAHGWAFTEGRKSWKRILLASVEKMAGLFTDRIVCVSHHDYALARRFRIAPERKLALVWNGVAAQKLSDSSVRSVEDIARIVFVGRLAVPKRPLSVIQAIRGIPKLHLTILGEGPQRAELESAVAELGLAGRVTFLGVRRDVSAILAEHHALVLASDWEGLPLVVIEAMLAGLPVVATNVGGVQELVKDGETGYLVQRGDENALRSAILKLVSEPSLARRMGQNGRRIAISRFAVESMVASYIQIYSQCLAKDHVGPQAIRLLGQS